MSKFVESGVYLEGFLHKRQRGLHASNAKKLKFQERYCRLTKTSLDYYDPSLKKRVYVCYTIHTISCTVLLDTCVYMY